MTLLELVLSVTILVSITALVGAMWVEVRSWSGDASLAQESMRLQRVVSLARDQWSQRRTVVALTSDGESLMDTDRSLTFVTTKPILFPGWPLVRAAYIIEDDPDQTTRDGLPARRLVYEETRVVDFDAPPSTGIGADGQPLAQRISLLESCDELAFERLLEVAPEPGADDPLRRDGGLTRWISYEEEFDSARLLGVRLKGIEQGEAFTCGFVVRASR